MSVQLSSPPGLMQPVPYHHVALGTGSRLLMMAGQVARTEDGKPPEGVDLPDQIVQALRNVSRGLTGAGGSFRDVMRLTFYVVDWSAASIKPFTAGLDRAAAELGFPDPMPPFTVIGVQALYNPDLLVEIEVTAVLP